MSLFTDIDGSPFLDNAKKFYKAEFLLILEKFCIFYNLIIEQNQQLTNDEDQIRDFIYLNYLRDQQIRDKYGFDYHCECEPKEFGINDGYLDFKICNANIFKNQFEYYIIECKRLDDKNLRGVNGLNAKYISNGILRFVTKKYSLYHRFNAMFGFVVSPLNIEENVNNLNHLLNNNYLQAKTTNAISPIKDIPNYSYQYISEHNDIEENSFDLYHLMFDFSKNMV